MRVERPLSDGLRVKKGQLMVRTVCNLCGAEFHNPTRAEQHLRKQHLPPALDAKGGQE